MIPYDVADAARRFARQLREQNEGVKPVSHNADEMRNLAQQLMLKAAWLDKIPQIDPFDDGTVLKFSVSSGGEDYTYVALRIANGWWLSGRGRPSQHPYHWSALITWLQNHSAVSDIWVMTETWRIGEDPTVSKKCGVPVACPPFEDHPLMTAQGRVGQTVAMCTDGDECQCLDHQYNPAKIEEHAANLRNFFNPKADFVDTYPEGHEVPE